MTDYAAMARRMRKDYLVVPKKIFELGLDAGEFAVYCYLLSHADRRTNECFPGYKTIGEALNIGSTNTVRSYVSGLEEKDMLFTAHTVRRKRDGRKKNSTLLYTVYEVQEVINRRNWREVRRAEREQEKQKAKKKADKKGVRIIPNDSVIA